MLDFKIKFLIILLFIFVLIEFKVVSWEYGFYKNIMGDIFYLGDFNG